MRLIYHLEPERTTLKVGVFTWPGQANGIAGIIFGGEASTLEHR